MQAGRVAVVKEATMTFSGMFHKLGKLEGDPVAMAMGDEFEPKDIHAYQIADFAETCGLDRKLVARMLADLAKSVLQALHDKHFLIELFEQHDLSTAEHAYIDALLENIKVRTTYLKSQVQDISTIEL